MSEEWFLEGFEWDEANRSKNAIRHGVEWWECEQVFFNIPLVINDDVFHGDEERFVCLGKTDAGRRLFLAFTVRGELIRIISARDMTKGERGIYHEYE